MGDSTAQVLPDHREGEEWNNVEDMKQVLKRSGKLVKQRLEKVDLLHKMEEEMTKHSEEVAESQAEVCYGGWVGTNMLVRVGRVELVSGMRGLARGEEHRRVVATSTSRRGNRFNHFFAHNEVFIGQKCLNRLCNALVDKFDKVTYVAKDDLN